MPINNSYNEEAIVKAIATALDSFYTNLIGNIDKLNIKKGHEAQEPVPVPGKSHERGSADY